MPTRPFSPATPPYFQGFPATPKTRYEGDAALGWFKANQSAYPNATVSKGLTFENVDIRHQIFTQAVNYGDFQDGDRNTVIIDEDGSLTGFQVLDSADQPVRGAHPVSLNNLGFNHAGNSVDECLAEGQQDTDVEARPTSLISPYGVATLELQANFPPSTGRSPGPQPRATRHQATPDVLQGFQGFLPRASLRSPEDGADQPQHPGSLGAEGRQRRRLHGGGLPVLQSARLYGGSSVASRRA